MRITTNQMYTTANAHMLQNQKNLAAVQVQLTSGKKLQSLADDPVAGNKIITLQREIERYTVMNMSIDTANTQLNSEEEALSSLTNLTDRLQEISISLGNVTFSDSVHEDFAIEMTELVDMGQSLFNYQDTKGEYLFAGAQGGKPAYELEAGRWVFKGDGENRHVKVSTTFNVQVSDSGQDIFEIESPLIPRDNILNQTLDMINDIRALDMSIPADAATFEVRREAYMGKVSNMQDSMRHSISNLGARMVNLDAVKESNANFKMNLSKALSDVQDLDYAKASSDLAKTQTALEASYASFAKIQGMSLFNYIK
jgi:flagellar hook-associated protein 3 FlgL